MTHLVLLYKILNWLVSIEFHVEFYTVEDSEVRRRSTADIVNCKDTSTLRCTVTPHCDSFRNYFSIDHCLSGTNLSETTY